MIMDTYESCKKYRAQFQMTYIIATTIINQEHPDAVLAPFSVTFGHLERAPCPKSAFGIGKVI